MLFLFISEKHGILLFISETHGIWENNTGHGKSRVTVNRETTVFGIKLITTIK